METDTDNNLTKTNDESVCLFTIVEGIRTTWEMTGSCDLGCKHCCIDAHPDFKINLTIEKAKEVLNELIEKNVKAIYISGGEPLSWDKLPDSIEYAKKIGISLISLATNGTRINSINSQTLKDAGVDKFLLSLDSHREEVHDDFRGKKGVFKKATKAIEYLKRKDNFVRVGTVIWSGNVDELEEMTEAMYNLGVDEIAFSWLMKSGRALKHPEIFIPQSEYFEIGNRLGKLKEIWKDELLISYHRFNKINDNYLGCQGGTKFLHIDPLGHLSPCSWITKLSPQFVSKGTVYTNSISDLIYEGPLEDFRKAVRERESKYGVGCPAICLIEHNDLFVKDPLYSV